MSQSSTTFTFLEFKRSKYYLVALFLLAIFFAVFFYKLYDLGVKKRQMLQAEVKAAALGDISTTVTGLNAPRGIIFDSSGNYYISDQLNHIVKKVDVNNVVTAYAGNGVSAYAGDGGPATNASLAQPRGLAFDAAGNLYIADFGNCVIRKVDVGGTITTVAGNNTCAFAGDGGPATSANLFLPSGVTFDSSGNMYITDQGNKRIRKVDTLGDISTVAGDGSGASSGDGGPATSAGIDNPARVAFDTLGNMYISEASGHKIRKVDTLGDITTFAGTGAGTGTVDGEGGDPSDDLGDGGPALTASLRFPVGLYFDNAGNLYIGDSGNRRVRKIDTGGNITTIAGNGTVGFSGDGGSAIDAQLNGPSDLALSMNQDIYFTDQGNNRVRKVDNSFDVVSIVPPQNGFNVAASANILIVFDGSLNTASVNQANLPIFAAGVLIDGTYAFSTTNVANDTVTFDPDENLEPGRTIEVVVSSNVQSSGGVPVTPFLSNFVVAATEGNGTFATQQVYSATAGRQPTDIQPYDLDNDGDVDLAVSLGNFGTAGMGVYMNNGDGTYGDIAIYATGLNPRRIEVADVNNDNFADLIVVAQNSTRLDVFINNGDGTFPAAVSYGCATSCEALKAVDLNSDGFIDIVISVPTGDYMRIFINNGDGTFAAGVDYATNNPNGLAIGDFDNDGDADFFVGSINGANIVSYFENQGDGTFGAKVDSVLAGNISWGISGDFNTDGDLDAAFSNQSTNELTIFIGNGDGTFEDAATYAVGNSPTGLTHGDFDADGDLDIAVANSSNETVSVLLNNGSGIFTLDADYSVDTPGSNFTASVRAADLNGDGALDLTVANQHGESISVLMGIGPLRVSSIAPSQHAVHVSNDSDISIVFNQSLNPATVTSSNVLLRGSERGILANALSVTTTNVADDTIVINPTTNFRVGERMFVTVKTGIQSASGLNLPTHFISEFAAAVPSGLGTFGSRTIYAAQAEARTANHGDLNSDGAIDIIVANHDTDTISVYINNGDGTFAPQVVYPAGNGPSYKGAIADFNGDGVLDFVVPVPADGVVSYYRNLGAGTFASRINISTGGGNPSGVTANDFDGDGDYDLAINKFFSNTVGILFNNGAGAFSGLTNYATGTRPFGGIASADVENDGDIDLIVTSSNSNQVSIHLNNGDGTFAPRIIYTATSGTDDVEVRDLNEDGFVDMAATTNANLNIFLNDGDGTFAGVASYSTSSGGAQGLTSGDVDADGDIDLLVSLQSSDGIRVWFNDGNAVFASPVNYAVGDNPDYGVMTSDFDNDGDIDFAVPSGNGFSGNLNVYFNQEIIPPVVSILSPNGGETLSAGSVHDIVWVATDNSGTVSTIDLEFTSDNGGNWQLIAGATGLSNGTFYSFDSAWGTPGSGNGQFLFIGGIAIDTSGNVYAADQNNNRIQKFDSNGTYLAQWGSSGNGNGEFSAPRSIAVDAVGNLYVTEIGNNRIQKFTSNGVYLAQWGSFGSGNGQFNDPRGIAVDNEGNVYVTDIGNSRVQKFDSNGTYLAQWGGSGSGDGQFSIPRGIAVDAVGNVYVADQNNNRIQKFDSNGTYLAQWGGAGSENGQFNTPRGVAVDAEGNVYVTDQGNTRIQKFDSNGTYLVQWGESGSGDGQFITLDEIAVAQSGILYATDAGTARVQKFLPGGAFNWTVPDTATSLARIRATATDASSNTAQDSSDAVFTIEVPSSGNGGTAQLRQLPASPIAGEAAALSDSVIRWNFTDQSTNESGFKLIGSDGSVLIAAETPNISSLEETGLEMNTVYSGRKVLAFNQNGESSPSAEFQSAVTSIPALQAVVLDKTDTTLTLAADQIVKNLDQGQSALQFELMTFGGETGATSVIQSDWVQTSSYQFTGLAPSTVFQARIRARNQAGEQTDWGAFSEPISLEEAQIALLSVSLNITDQNGVSLNTDPMTTEERVFVRITTANIGNQPLGNVFVNMVLPEGLRTVAGTLHVNGTLQTDTPDADLGQLAPGSAGVIWPSLPPSAVQDIVFEIDLKQTQLQDGESEIAAYILQASVSAQETESVVISQKILFVDLSSFPVAPEPPVMLPADQEPVLPPTADETSQIDGIHQLIGEETSEIGGMIGNGGAGLDQGREVSTQSSSDGKSFAIAVSEADNGRRTIFEVTGSARVTGDQIEFIGRSSQPDTVMTLIFNNGVSVIVRTDASGFWQTYVSAEQLGIDLGMDQTVRIDAVASVNDTRSEIVHVGDFVLSHAADGSVLAEFSSIVSSSQALTAVRLAVKELVKTVERNEEQIQQTLTVAAPVVVISSAPLWGYLPYLPTLLYHAITYLVGLIGRRKKGQQRFFGVAYDAITKDPLALAIIRLYKKDGESERLVSTFVTDKQGKYDALLEPGSYRIEVKKPEYTFPSSILSGISQDGQYDHVYQGGIEITDQTTELIVPDLPMDPINAEQKWQTANILKKLWLTLQKAGHFLALPLLFVGSLASVVVVAAVPENPINWILSVAYVLMFLLQLKLRQKPEKAWGIVYDIVTNAPLPLVNLQLIDPAFGKVVASRLSDYQGRFRFAPEPGKYVLKAEKPGFQQSETIEAPKDRQTLPSQIIIEREGESIKGDLGLRQA